MTVNLFSPSSVDASTDASTHRRRAALRTLSPTVSRPALYCPAMKALRTAAAAPARWRSRSPPRHSDGREQQQRSPLLQRARRRGDRGPARMDPLAAHRLRQRALPARSPGRKPRSRWPSTRPSPRATPPALADREPPRPRRAGDRGDRRRRRPARRRPARRSPPAPQPGAPPALPRPRRRGEPAGATGDRADADRPPPPTCAAASGALDWVIARLDLEAPVRPDDKHDHPDGASDPRRSDVRTPVAPSASVSRLAPALSMSGGQLAAD